MTHSDLLCSVLLPLACSGVAQGGPFLEKAKTASKSGWGNLSTGVQHLLPSMELHAWGSKVNNPWCLPRVMWRCWRHSVTGMTTYQAPRGATRALGRAVQNHAHALQKAPVSLPFCRHHTHPVLLIPYFSAAAHRGSSPFPTEEEQSAERKGRFQEQRAELKGMARSECLAQLTVAPRGRQTLWASCWAAPAWSKRHPVLKQGMNIHEHEPLQTHLGKKIRSGEVIRLLKRKQGQKAAVEGRIAFKMQGEISFLQSSCDPLDHAPGIVKLSHISTA